MGTVDTPLGGRAWLSTLSGLVGHLVVQARWEMEKCGCFE